MLDVPSYQVRWIFDQFTLNQGLYQLERRPDKDERNSQDEFHRAIERFQENAQNKEQT